MAKTKPQDASASRDSTPIQKAAMLKALEKSLGIVTTAANQVGISRETHRKWCINDAEYAAKVEEIKDIKLDFLESKAHQRVNEGSDTMIIFMLKTQGKKRGYIERQEVETRAVDGFLTDEEREELDQLRAEQGQDDK